jgi:hypothetical protein
MSSPLLPFVQNSYKIFSSNYYNEDPEHIDDHQLQFSIKTYPIPHQNLNQNAVDVHHSDEDEIESVWRTNLMIDGEEERRKLCIESSMVKKTSL